MTKRIRYEKHPKKPHILISVRNFRGNQGAYYKVKIDTNDLTYKVINVRTELILRSTEKDGKKSPKNLYTVYEQVKRALRTLGVKFERECRGL
jgi:hypothetical protein